MTPTLKREKHEQFVQIAIAQQRMEVAGCSDCNSSAGDASEQVVQIAIAQQRMQVNRLFRLQ